jgi:hypothetical protein
VLSVNTGYPIFHPVFTPEPRLMFWGEEDPDDFRLEGWYADPEGCAPKRRFTRRLAQLLAVRDGILYGEYGEDGEREVMTLRHAPLAGGALPADGGPIVAYRVDARVALAGAQHLVYTQSRSDPPYRGLYLYGPLP